MSIAQDALAQHNSGDVSIESRVRKICNVELSKASLVSLGE